MFNNSKLNSCDKFNTRKSKSSQKDSKLNNIIQIEEEFYKKNIYMEASLNLTEYIKNFYKKYKKYPNTNLSFYKYGRLIGQGAFGKVNLGSSGSSFSIEHFILFTNIGSFDGSKSISSGLY